MGTITALRKETSAITVENECVIINLINGIESVDVFMLFGSGTGCMRQGVTLDTAQAEVNYMKHYTEVGHTSLRGDVTLTWNENIEFPPGVHEIKVD